MHMLEVKKIREHLTTYKLQLGLRNLHADQLDGLDEIIKLDDLRIASQIALDNELAQRNNLSKEIGELYKSGQKAAADEMKSQVAAINSRAKEIEEELSSIQAKQEILLLDFPNVPHKSVPAGNSDEDNEVIKDWTGAMPDLPEDALPHWELASKYDLFDLALGAKITGAGFPIYRKKGAALQRALITFFLNEAIAAGYEEIIPPILVNEDSARATGQLPDKEGQMYFVERDNLYLIPTSEVPLTNIYRDDIIAEEDLPIKLTGFTPCFRREAGSYGADVKGLNRLHQFDKIEIVQIVEPAKSYEVHKTMVAHVESLLVKLQLPYRILNLCAGDLGHASALTYDFEVYSAAQGRWLEVSSVSNFETFQSNRLKVRYRTADGTKLLHTLNGSALALARIVAAIIENYQDENGIRVPEVLVPFTGFDRID